MRAIGNLFLLVEEEHLKIEKFKELVEEAAIVLNINSSSENNMKVIHHIFKEIFKLL